MLVGRDAVQTDCINIIYRSAHPDGAPYVGGACLELVRQGVIQRLFECDRADHIAAALIWRHLLKQFFFSVEDADAARTVNLVARDRIEVSIQLLDVDLDMRRSLGPVDEYEN